MKPEFIAHRVNTVAELEELPPNIGVELDLRDRAERLILQHDPFADGEDFEPFLKAYKGRNTLILNIKSERIEHRVIELINKYQISKYFFLDSSLPMLVALSKLGEKKLAVRFSEFESIESVALLKKRVEWVWVDCFTKLPINYEIYARLKSFGFKLCLVSPELQGRPEDIPIYRDYLNQENIIFDAICTKFVNFKTWNMPFSVTQKN